jgi:hypothetical protein
MKGQQLVCLVLAMSILLGCSDQEQIDLCSPGEELSVQGAAMCVYSSEVIIETGFRCPDERPNRHDYRDIVICCDCEEMSEQEQQDTWERYHRFPSVEEDDTDLGEIPDVAWDADSDPGDATELDAAEEQVVDRDTGEDRDVEEPGIDVEGDVQPLTGVFEWCMESLSPEEREESLFEGSFTIRNAMDVSTLTPYAAMSGRLDIEAPGLYSVVLPNLACVGSIDLWTDSVDLQTIEMSRLKGIAGDLVLEGWPTDEDMALDSIRFPSLERIEGKIELESLNSLETVSFPSLELLGEILFVATDDMLTTVEFPALTSIGGHLLLTTNPLLSEVALGALVHLGGAINIYENPNLPQCWATALLARLTELGFQNISEIRDNDLDATCE